MEKAGTYIKDYKEKGYAILKNVFKPSEIGEIAQAIDEVKKEGMQFESSFRHQNLLFLIQPDPEIGKVLRFCQWPSYSHVILEKYRTDKRFLNILKPLLGSDIKQIINQIIWKTPGVKQTTYGYHQDARFRRPESAYRQLKDSFVQVALAIDPHTINNGCLTFIERSHLLGNLKYITSKSVYQENMSQEVLDALDLKDHPKINVLLNPGDIAIWHPFLLHGSGPNNSNIDRRTYLNGYVTAKNCDRGEWAFKNGKPTKLQEPKLVQYEDLHIRPEPHYVNGSAFHKK